MEKEIEVYESFDDYAAGHKTKVKIDENIRDRKRAKSEPNTARPSKERKDVRRKPNLEDVR